MTAHKLIPEVDGELILSSDRTRVYAAGKVVSVVYDATISAATTWTYLPDAIPEGYRPAVILYNIAFDNVNRVSRIVVNPSGQIGGYVQVAGARMYGTVTYVAA